MTDIKEDYLEVDKPIPGQNYVCLSFVSPEKLVKNKELFSFQKYLDSRYQILLESLDKTLKKSDSDIKNKINNSIKEDIRLALKFDYDQFSESFDNFKFKNNNTIEDGFDKINDYQTSMKGLKVRGVYNTYKEAQIRSKVLQRIDQSFNVYIGQIGYWLPWNPEADKIEEQEYMEDDLNKLMKEYKKNEIQRDMFYEEQKREQQKDASKNLKAELLKKEIEPSKPLEEPSNNLESTQENLLKEDPWLQRKNESEDNSLDDTNVKTI